MVRLHPELGGKLDNWRDRQEPKPSRPEAIRQLVELGLDFANNDY